VSICDANAPVAAVGDEPQVLGLVEQVVELSQDFNESWGPFDVVEDKYHNDGDEGARSLKDRGARNALPSRRVARRKSSLEQWRLPVLE
jgi:hypothetical protein